MRIGVNARTFSVEEPGGAVQSARRLTRELVESTEHDIVLFGAESLRKEFDVELYTGGFVETQLWGMLWERTILPRLAKRTGIDVLYCPNGNAPAHRTQVPVVMCIHDVNAQKGWSSGIHQLYRKTMVPSAARAADGIVTVSDFSKREITESFNIEDSKISVIYNGVDEVYFEGESRPIDLPDRYILFVGSLNPRKNIRGVLNAFEELTDSSNLQLVLVGPDNKEIFKNVGTMTGDRIVRCGFLAIDEVKYAYENAEALVFPSFYEGFGLPPLEALACGTPVVASDRGSLPEILGDTATYVDPESPSDIARGICETINGDYDKARLSKAASQYKWSAVADRTVNALKTVI
jgi:glycosyltransferase involved in cell wall biosynthesis